MSMISQVQSNYHEAPKTTFIVILTAWSLSPRHTSQHCQPTMSADNVGCHFCQPTLSADNIGSCLAGADKVLPLT